MTARDIIYRLGIPGNYIGHHCLAAGVELMAANPSIIFKVTTELYPAIARRLDSTPDNVERNIRTVINTCWTNGNRAFLEEVARCPLSGPPRPAELIDLIHAYLVRENTRTTG